MGPTDRGISKINYISISYLGIIKLLNLCSIYTFILKSMLFAMLIKTARLQSHYCLYLMVPIAILFNVLIGYGINVHVSKKPEKTEYFVDRCLSFSFGHCVVCPSICRF